jgi:hypothetical protein
MYLDHYKDDDSGVGWLLFAMLMLAVMVVSFAVAYAALHLWTISTLLLRLSERRWIKVGWWTLILAVLVYPSFRGDPGAPPVGGRYTFCHFQCPGLHPNK